MLKQLLVLGFVLLPFFVLAQNSVNQDEIVGLWLPSNQKARIQIKKVDNTYQGWIVWLKEPNDENGNAKVDKNNPDEKFRKTPLLGYRLLRNFTHKADNVWHNGTIYDPENGSTYNCTITMVDPNTIEVRGYIGVSLFGRTDTWKRLAVKQK